MEKKRDWLINTLRRGDRNLESNGGDSHDHEKNK